MSDDTGEMKTWFITGASSGLGQHLALAALREGHRVIGTGRNVKKAAADNPEFARLGGQWLELDLAQTSCQTVLEDFLRQEGAVTTQGQNPHWVVVNNAGYTLLGAAEDMSEEQVASYFQANVFGVIRVWKAFLPLLRCQRRGTLITISSIWGFASKAEHMMYSAVKATTESLTESYANLLAPFGIQTMIIEPGGFRTPFASNNIKADGGISDDYKEKIEAWINMVDSVGKNPTALNGDPVLFGDRVLDAVQRRGLFSAIFAQHDGGKVLRVQLGSDCYEIFGDKVKDLTTGYAEMSEIAKSTDVGYRPSGQT